MAVLISAVAETSQQPNVLFPTLPDLVWSAIIMAIALILVAKFVVPKFRDILDQRNTKIRQGVQLAEDAKQTVADAKAQAAAEVDQARREAAQIRDDAHAQAARTVAEAKDRAEAEAARILDNAERQIQAQRQAAEISLRSDVGLLASELAEKIVGEQLRDRELSVRVIDRFLDQLETTGAKKG